MTRFPKYPSGGNHLKRTTPTQAEVEAAFRGQYVDYQYCFVDFFAEHLAGVSRVFRGDLQMAVLLAIIGQVTLQAVTVARRNGRPIKEMPPERRGITTFRLSDATGIPRETVRRKLARMEELGWLQREENYWTMAFAGDDAKARLDLEGVDSRNIVRAARFFASVTPLVMGAEKGNETK